MRSVSLFLTTLAVAASLCAKECKKPCEEVKKPQPIDIYCGGYTLGYSYNNMLGEGESVLTFGYIDDRFLADIGFNYEHIHNNVSDVHVDVSTFVAHLGLRDRIYQNLFVTYGAIGALSAGTTLSDVRPFSAGAFLGLDYQLMRHFLLSVKGYPFIFERTYRDVNYYEVFETGVITASYVF